MRTEPEHRLRVSMTRSDFARHVKYTAMKYQMWSDNVRYRALVDSGQVKPFTEEELVKKMQGDYLRRASDLEDFVILDLDNNMDQAPQLEAGQHRRFTFLEINHEKLQKCTGLNPGNLKVCHPPLHLFLLFPFPP